MNGYREVAIWLPGLYLASASARPGTAKTRSWTLDCAALERTDPGRRTDRDWPRSASKSFVHNQQSPVHVRCHMPTWGGKQKQFISQRSLTVSSRANLYAQSVIGVDSDGGNLAGMSSIHPR